MEDYNLDITWNDIYSYLTRAKKQLEFALYEASSIDLDMKHCKQSINLIDQQLNESYQEIEEMKRNNDNE